MAWLDIGRRYQDSDGGYFPSFILDTHAGAEQPRGNFVLSAETEHQLDAEVFEQFRKLALEADQLLQSENRDIIKSAFPLIISAIEILPAPKEQWNAMGWLLARLAELYFRTGNYAQAADVLGDVMWTPGAIGNPWIHLRQGQVQFALDNPERALDELMRAYMGGGKAIFSLEDPKYYEFLQSEVDGLE